MCSQWFQPQPRTTASRVNVCILLLLIYRALHYHLLICAFKILGFKGTFTSVRPKTIKLLMMLQRCTSTSIMSAFLRYCLCHQTRRASVCQTSNSRTENPASGFEWLFKCAPSFYIDGNNVQVLNEPSEFYNTLKVNEFKELSMVTTMHLMLSE